MKTISFIFTMFVVSTTLLAQQQWTQTIKIVRPWNVTQYTAGDAVQDSNSVWRVVQAGFFNGAYGTLQGGLLSVDTANILTGTFRLYAFNDTVGIQSSPVADNVAQPITAAMALKLVGYVDFTLSTGGAGSTSAYSYATPALRYETGTGKYLYCILTATGAYTPNRGNTFILRLTFTQ